MGSAGRVLILVENLSVPFDRRVWLEANCLKRAGYGVYVISPKSRGQALYEVLDGIEIYRFPNPPATKGVFSFLWEFFYCWMAIFLLTLKIFLKRGFDIIHACNPPDTFFLIGLFYKIFGKKFIFDQHDLCPEVYLAKFEQNKKDFFYWTLLFLEWLTYRTADRVISTNDFYRGVALKRGKVKRDKLFVVRTGFNSSQLKRRSPRAELKNNKQYLAVYLGVMAPQDGVENLIRSIDLIVHFKGRRDIQFVLVGGGDSFDYLVELANTLRLGEFVRFTGRIPDRELFEYLSTADICLAPDPKNELNDISTMNKIIEYIAFERPIVSFNLKETRNMAGDSAVYAKDNDINDFSEKLLAVLDDGNKRFQMELAAKRKRANFSFESFSSRLLETYAGL